MSAKIFPLWGKSREAGMGANNATSIQHQIFPLWGKYPKGDGGACRKPLLESQALWGKYREAGMGAHAARRGRVNDGGVT